MRKLGYIFLVLGLLFILGIANILRHGFRHAERAECNISTLPASVLPGAGPLRIAVIGDAHLMNVPMSWALHYLRKEKPDIIFFVGDLVTGDTRFSRSRTYIHFFETLKTIAPVYAILGNHDYEKLASLERVYAEAGVPLLRNRAIEWTSPAGKTIRIIGLGDWNEGNEKPALCMKLKGKEKLPVILLSHDANSRWLLRRYDWNLMLSGHTHGGQLGNPFTGQYIYPRDSMVAGLYDFEKEHHIFITRGLGALFKLRFFCPPEVNILNIPE